MRKRALLLTTTPRTSELEELVFALGGDVAGQVLQKRPQPDPVSYLGSGKLEEARALQRAIGAQLVVVNGALKPGQIFTIQRFFSEALEDGSAAPEVYDRTRLILEIFRDRARSPEARLQVELAQLEYDMPLVREAIAREKRGERQAAMFGSGEFGVDVEYDRMKRRMAKIRRELEHLRAERGVRRKHRRRSGFHLVSFAGYTNAGKSSLLNAMSEGYATAENRYFSTLSTKTARAKSERRNILLTDTVGFIEDLPAWMVEAFHSTLEEIALADVIVLVLDASDTVEEMTRRLQSSLRRLHEFDGGAVRGPTFQAGRLLAPIVVALNKADRLPPGALEEKRAALEAAGLLAPEMSVAVSARTGEGLPQLYEKLYASIPDYDELLAVFPDSPATEAAIAWLHDHTDVLDLWRDPTKVRFEAKRSLRDELQRRLQDAGATMG